MKNIIFTLVFAVVVFFMNEAYAKECKTLSKSDVQEVKEDVNTEVPKGMEGAVIIVRTKDGRESSVPIEKYKVVPRKQQFKVTKTNTTEKMLCEADETKNMIVVGGRKDHRDLDVDVSSDGKTASVVSEKGLVLDASYIRRKAIGPVGAGVGIDTNGTPKAMLSIDF